MYLPPLGDFHSQNTPVKGEIVVQVCQVCKFICRLSWVYVQAKITAEKTYDASKKDYHAVADTSMMDE